MACTATNPSPSQGHARASSLRVTVATAMLLAASILSMRATRASAFVHDTVLAHHTPKDCACAPWAANKSATRLWESKALASATLGCAMPANGLTPRLEPGRGMGGEEIVDGWCLCASRNTSNVHAVRDSAWSVGMHPRAPRVPCAMLVFAHVYV